MTSDRALLLAVERAAVRGWPAFETEEIDGWLARSSSGGSLRANTVAALAYTGADLDRSIGRVEAFYRAHGAVPRFTVTDVSEPPDIDAQLASRGWQRDDDHFTMIRAIGPIDKRSAVEVATHEAPTCAWYDVYLQGLSESRRAVAPRLVERVPAPRMLFSGVRDGAVIASGLSVLDGEVASVQCMATLPAARRTGAARAVLAAIEAFARKGGAKWLYLQAEAANAPAVTLYASVGFTIAGRYHTREKRG